MVRDAHRKDHRPICVNYRSERNENKKPTMVRNAHRKDRRRIVLINGREEMKIKKLRWCVMPTAGVVEATGFEPAASTSRT